VFLALGWSSALPAASTDRRGDFGYLGQYNFAVEVAGVTVGRFESMAGLECEMEIKEVPVPGSPVVRKVPGRSWWSRLVGRVGMAAADALGAWFSTAAGGHPEPRNGAVVMRSNAGDEVMRYGFFGAWPTGFRVAAVNPPPEPDPDFPDLTTPLWDLELVIEQAEIVFTIPPELVRPRHGRAWELWVDGVLAGVFAEAEVGDEPRLQVVQYTVEEIEDPTSGIERIYYTDAGGTEQLLTHRPTGMLSFPNVVLRRGTVAPLLWEWYRALVPDLPQSRLVELVGYDVHGRESARFSLSGAWPCKWKRWTLDGKGGDVTIEEVELAVDAIVRIPSSP